MIGIQRMKSKVECFGIMIRKLRFAKKVRLNLTEPMSSNDSISRPSTDGWAYKGMFRSERYLGCFMYFSYDILHFLYT